MDSKIHQIRPAWNEHAIVAGTILFISLMLTAKYFTGLENEPIYAGNVFQTLHPDAFPGDPYRGPEASFWQRPIQLSLLYGFVKLTGSIWLDDRFVALVFLLLVVAGLAGIDRTARLFGVTDVFGRMVVLFLFSRDHAVLDHKVLLAHHPDLNHMAVAIPIIVWLFYAALARKGLWVVLAIGAVLSLFSIRNALFPILCALAAVFSNGTKQERTAIAGICIAGALAFLAGITYLMPISDDARLILWNYIRIREGSDANPFDLEPEFVIGTFVWLTLMAAAYFAAPKATPAGSGARAISLAALAIWLIGGAYISWAPDALKAPLLIGFAPNRALAWPQNLAYVLLAAFALRHATLKTEPVRRTLAACSIVALFIIGPGNWLQWAILLTVAAVITFIWICVRFVSAIDLSARAKAAAGLIATDWRPALALSLGVVMAGTLPWIAMQQGPAWIVAFKHGVHGHNGTAPWIGIAEYIRDNTPANSSVLPIADVNGRLVVTRSLGTRAGRTMPVPEDYSPRFRDPRAWDLRDRQYAVLRELIKSLENRDYPAVSKLVTSLIPVPDYIIFPERIVSPTDAPFRHYSFETRIGTSIIFRRSLQREAQ